MKLGGCGLLPGTAGKSALPNEISVLSTSLLARGVGSAPDLRWRRWTSFALNRAGVLGVTFVCERNGDRVKWIRGVGVHGLLHFLFFTTGNKKEPKPNSN
jgi:hypothetical protein